VTSDPAQTARRDQERCAIRADLANLVAIVAADDDVDPDTHYWDICQYTAGIHRVRLVALLSQALLDLAQRKDSR
jgi:hypothetical protein